MRLETVGGLWATRRVVHQVRPQEAAGPRSGAKGTSTCPQRRHSVFFPRQTSNLRTRWAQAEVTLQARGAACTFGRGLWRARSSWPASSWTMSCRHATTMSQLPWSSMRRLARQRSPRAEDSGFQASSTRITHPSRFTPGVPYGAILAIRRTLLALATGVRNE